MLERTAHSATLYLRVDDVRETVERSKPVQEAPKPPAPAANVDAPAKEEAS